MHDDRLQFIVDEEGTETHVIVTVEVFNAMMNTLEELEEYYLSHHPEERKRRDAALAKLEQEQ